MNPLEQTFLKEVAARKAGNTLDIPDWVLDAMNEVYLTGYDEGLNVGREEGEEVGYDRGYERGYEDGIEEGYGQGRQYDDF